ncbi:MAG: hypothetical protein SWH61_17300 [Thermodesulfobacteriota bacterium]|nr:hypothetical protein [Thermodesulfobacteriota bacterium]
MHTIFNSLHESYITRCHQPEPQKSAWRSIVKNGFEPDLQKEWHIRPSVRLAKESGDLGMALLWIVQAALIRPCLTRLRETEALTSRQKDMLTAVDVDQIGALAHSEPPGNPLTLSKSKDRLGASGEKKYITAGPLADFFFMTAREKDDEKISCLLWVPGALIAPDELVRLDLNALFTSIHASLLFHKKSLPDTCLLPVRAPEIRRMIATWGMVERNLIVEAFTAFLSYLSNRIGMTDRHPAIEDILRRQQDAVTLAVQQARAGQFVDFPADNLKTIGMLTDNVISTASKRITDQADHTEILWRINDAAFLRNFWKGG